MEKYIEKMRKNDRFSAWLGLEIIEVREGYCKLSMEVREEMLNGFDILHGGVTFSMADSAFAFASNSYGLLSVALDVKISFTRAAKLGDTLYAETVERHVGKKVGMYDISITNQDSKIVALFYGTVFRTDDKI